MKVLLFGITQDIVGSASLSIPVAKSSKLASVSDLKDFLGISYPELNNLSSLAVAVNKKYAKDEDSICNFDEIALIPPVSGG
ncbi:MoaD/ThiS family protein [Eudoraea chungangensis]|uniref:MoaD/ThiS family protein n=1 Tax=Eudoraea chungangensis TaxID=1481905 RepID=UPI0023EC0217|nr:MoaD/ThiS family protein [Eudoraea chungangensis]